MISKPPYREGIYIADFTEYINQGGTTNVPSKGVYVGTEENGIIPSFRLTNDNAIPFTVINNEKNPSKFKRKDGKKVSQCECIIYADRNDNKKGWMIFLELKYCQQKNRYQNILDGIGQLRDTCLYVINETNIFESKSFKKYLVISTPGVTPLDPFDGSYFDQETMLSIKEKTGAIIKASNEGHILTPAVVKFEVQEGESV
jgi:hypothetical protein